MPYGNVLLLSGLPSMKADVVSASGYGFGCSPDGRPLGGRPPMALGAVQDVPLLQTPRTGRAGYTAGVDDYATVIASSAGAGSVEGLRLSGLGAFGLPMPTKWWHWAAVLGVGYLAWKQWGK